MLKHTITYKDFNDEEVTEDLYFNITETELIELEVEHKEGLQEWVRAIIAAKDRKTMIAEFQRIILLAYGEKSPDGKSFIKNDDLREKFKQTAAYNALFVQLATEEDAAATFIQGVVPKDIGSKIDIEEAKKVLENPNQ